MTCQTKDDKCYTILTRIESVLKTKGQLLVKQLFVKTSK